MFKFRKFDEIFGHQNVILRKFNPPDFPNHCVISDFFGQTGLQPPPQHSIIRINESLSKEACGILYAYRKFIPTQWDKPNAVKENILLIDALLKMKGDKLRFSAQLMTTGLAQEAADIRWIEKRLQAPLNDNSPQTRPGEIASESDLLQIDAESLRLFKKTFEELYNLSILPDLLPSGNPVAPNEAADFVQICREIAFKTRDPRTIKRKKTGSTGITGKLIGFMKKLRRGSQ